MLHKVHGTTETQEFQTKGLDSSPGDTYLPRMCEAPVSIPTTTINKQKD